MATPSDHIALANKNQAALEHLQKEAARFPEWVCTTAFYKAVQICEAMFVSDNGKNCHDHGNRLRRIKTGKYQEMYRAYRILWSASTVARYLHDNDKKQDYCTFTDYIPAEQVEEKIVRNRLQDFEGKSLKFLGELGKSLQRSHVANKTKKPYVAKSKETPEETPDKK